MAWKAVRATVPISRPGNRAGFSLMELMVVLVLMGAVAMVVMPSFVAGFKGLEVEAEVRDLITRMKRARSEAVAAQKAYRIILHETPEGTYYYSFTNEFEEELKRFLLPREIAVVPAEGDEFPLRVGFYPNGRSSGSRFALQNRQGKRLLIEVDPITGFAKMVRSER